jgi:hypothetical protein
MSTKKPLYNSVKGGVGSAYEEGKRLALLRRSRKRILRRIVSELPKQYRIYAQQFIDGRVIRVSLKIPGHRVIWVKILDDRVVCGWPNGDQWKTVKNHLSEYIAESREEPDTPKVRMLKSTNPKRGGPVTIRKITD